MAYRLASGALACMFFAAAVGGAFAQPAAAPAAVLPTRDAALVLETSGAKIRVVLVADGLVAPWDLAFLPDGNLLVTESSGALRIVEKGVLNPAAVWKAPSPDGNDVLHGLVLHPDFALNRFVYASYLKDGGEKGQTLAISRGR